MRNSSCRVVQKSATAFLSLALVFALSIPAWASGIVTIPTGTVIPLRMDTYLSSESSRVGDRFTGTASRDVIVDGMLAVPAGTKVEGHVTGATPATRSRAGTIAVAFDRLRFAGGSSTMVDGTLTTLSEEGRRQIEASNEDVIGGGSRTRRAVVFIGGGAGAGALIGALAGGGKGAAVGAGLGAVLGTIGVLLNQGEKAEVQTGTEFGMMLESTVTVDTDSAGIAGGRDFSEPQQSVFNSFQSVQFAQIALRDRGYYNGPINGEMTVGTREALRRYQRDHNLPISGDLNPMTARDLGIASELGFEAAPIEIADARAERVGRDRDGIRIFVDVHTNGSGWQVFVNRFVSNNVLHVYVRGVPPRQATGTALDHHPFTDTFNNLGTVTRVVFHGPQRDYTVDLRGGAIGGGNGPGLGTGNPRQIGFLANRLLQDYQRELNVRGSRGQVIFDTRRNFRQNEVELLFQLNSLQASAELYNQMVSGVTDPDALRGAADSLIRQMRLASRIMRRADAALSSIVSNDWSQLRDEVRLITVTDANIDTDTDVFR